MSSIGDSEQEAQKRNLKNMKGLWRDTFRALKKSTTSSSGHGVDEPRLSFARRFSLGKKKHNHNESEQVVDETTVDPVYETLKIAAETRKLAVATYLQQRQQVLNTQTSLNSQGSSELDIQASPKIPRHTSRPETEITSSLKLTLPPVHRQGTSSTGKRYSTGHLFSMIDKYQLSNRHKSLESSSRDFILKSSKKK